MSSQRRQWQVATAGSQERRQKKTKNESRTHYKHVQEKKHREKIPEDIKLESLSTDYTLMVQGNCTCGNTQEVLSTF